MSKYSPLTKAEFLKYRKMITTGRNPLEPEDYLEGLKMSLAKWHPLRGIRRGLQSKYISMADSCGLCTFFDPCCDMKAKRCPLLTNNGCTFFYKWDDARVDKYPKSEINKCADKLYNQILKAYKKEVKQ